VIPEAFPKGAHFGEEMPGWVMSAREYQRGAAAHLQLRKDVSTIRTAAGNKHVAQ
jgi:hypothetical protein